MPELGGGIKDKTVEVFWLLGRVHLPTTLSIV